MKGRLLRVLAGVILSGFMALTASAPAAATEMNQPASDFTLKSLGGKNLKLSEMAGNVVLINFWASWCGPCRMVAPVVKELGEDYAGRLIVGKVDVDSNPGIASKFGIRNIPTILFFKDGAVVEKHVGAAPKTTLASKVESIL